MKFETIEDEYHVIYVRTHYGYCCELRSIAISNEITKKVSPVSSKTTLRPLFQIVQTLTVLISIGEGVEFARMSRSTDCGANL